MRNYLFIIALTAVLTMTFAVPGVQAAGTAEAASGSGSMDVAVAAPSQTQIKAANLPDYLDEDLVSKHSDFSHFAQGKVRSLNQNHTNSKSRMQIERLADGTYRARYHSIDGNSLVCKVRRSKSQTIPYVGVLSYKERIFEAVGNSPEDCRRANFIPVAVIPNRHIFSFKKGTWQ
jgi:hypothetical protein